MQKLMVAKIGTGDIVTPSGQPRIDRLEALVDQADWLRAAGIMTVFVSSGAAALGAGEEGQGRLNDAWTEASGGRAEELLVARSHLFTPDGRQGHAETVHKAVAADRLPVVNGHYAASDDERLPNNDLVAGAEASLLRSYYGSPLAALALLSVARGVRRPDGTVLTHVHEANIADCVGLVSGGTSAMGTGGMMPKVETAWGAVRGGHADQAVIASAVQTDVLVGAVTGTTEGTLFTAKAPLL